MNHTTKLAFAVAAIMAWASGTGFAAAGTATVLQGGVARWSGGDATECGIFGRRYAAIDGVCYFPVDMKAKPGVTEIALWDKKGARTLGTLTVTKRECTDTQITLDDDNYVTVSDANKVRSIGERARIVAAVAGGAGDPGFVLPLGAPAEGVVTRDRSDFCELRIYNDGLVKSRHTGLDYALPEGTPVIAGADGIVTLAEDQFYTGNTVVVDHGGGLVTMVFHLKHIAVEQGAAVRRGERLATVGSTGRSTGAHLHYGARYQNQRIDVGALLGDPVALAGVGEGVAAPTGDTAAVAVDSALPSSEDAAGEDLAPPAAAAAAGDDKAEDAQSAEQSGDPEAADAVETQADALDQEKAAQDAADEAAIFQ